MNNFVLQHTSIYVTGIHTGPWCTLWFCGPRGTQVVNEMTKMHHVLLLISPVILAHLIVPSTTASIRLSYFLADGRLARELACCCALPVLLPLFLLCSLSSVFASRNMKSVSTILECCADPALVAEQNGTSKLSWPQPPGGGSHRQPPLDRFWPTHQHFHIFASYHEPGTWYGTYEHLTSRRNKYI